MNWYIPKDANVPRVKRAPFVMLFQISPVVICAGFGGREVAVAGNAVEVLVGVTVGIGVLCGAGVKVGFGVPVSTGV